MNLIPYNPIGAGVSGIALRPPVARAGDPVPHAPPRRRRRRPRPRNPRRRRRRRLRSAPPAGVAGRRPVVGSRRRSTMARSGTFPRCTVRAVLAREPANSLQARGFSARTGHHKLGLFLRRHAAMRTWHIQAHSAHSAHSGTFGHIRAHTLVGSLLRTRRIAPGRERSGRGSPSAGGRSVSDRARWYSHSAHDRRQTAISVHYPNKFPAGFKQNPAMSVAPSPLAHRSSGRRSAASSPPRRERTAARRASRRRRSSLDAARRRLSASPGSASYGIGNRSCRSVGRTKTLADARDDQVAALGGGELRRPSSVLNESSTVRPAFCQMLAEHLPHRRVRGDVNVLRQRSRPRSPTPGGS